MPLAHGSRLGPYEIISAIGTGGMGEVYEARDPRLNRTVAIKVLLDHISDHPEAMVAATITTQPVFTADSPRTLFKGTYVETDTGGAGYDVAADGRFLMVQPMEAPQPATSINLVLNWFDELKRIAPASAR
jgi:serine/threonine protein kinase